MPSSKSKSSYKTVGITVGDPAGIGPEVTARALTRASLRRLARFKIFGEQSLFKKYRFPVAKNCELIDLGRLKAGRIPLGQATDASASASLRYLQAAVRSLKDKTMDALVTAPVCKEAIAALGERFDGHTEYLAEAFQTRDFEMMFVAPSGLRVIIVTRHIPLCDVSRAVSKEKVYRTIALAHRVLKAQFHIPGPRIAVCGLNPHAGEGGLIGNEEITRIIPAIALAQKEGIKASGPFSADTIFAPRKAGQFDLIVAMYHDQGLAPVKALFFNRLVNVTIGLPFVRTSPAHGTAFDIAGKNRADPASMIEAIRFAATHSR